MLHHFDTADLAVHAWKNGGGSTREIVCSPLGAGIDHFVWRVSIATIAQSGPFSIFAGVDRVIMLLAGAQNLREVALFPMNQQAVDLLMGSPSEASNQQLRDLHIRLNLPEK